MQCICISDSSNVVAVPHRIGVTDLLVLRTISAKKVPVSK